MRLKPNWQAIFRKAWSIRLAALAGLFSGAEVILPLFVDSMPRSVFALLSLIAVAGVVWTRLLDQPKAGL